VQRMGRLSWNPKINVKHNSLVYQRSLPEKNPFHLFPISARKKPPIWVGYLATLRLGLWESAGNFIIFFLRILVSGGLISVAARAQVLPGGSSQHHFWDAANKLLFASHAVLEALDFGITHRNLSEGGREMESMAKALRESGTAGQLVFFGGRMAGVVGISYLWHRTGHHKLGAGFSGLPQRGFCVWVGYSLAHR
jgi:hypothetical protein